MPKSAPILLAVDFGPRTDEAIQQASLLAQLNQSDLYLLHAIHVLPQSFGVAAQTDAQSQDLISQTETQVRDLLREAKKKYIPLAVTARSQVRVGSWFESLRNVAEEIRPCLIMFPDLEGELGQSFLELAQQMDEPFMVYTSERDLRNSNVKGVGQTLVGTLPGWKVEKTCQSLVGNLSLMSQQIELVTWVTESRTPNQHLSEQLEAQLSQLPNLRQDQMARQIVT
ncbi:MAG: universal stress protein, partial [Bacteroidota bacterium]